MASAGHALLAVSGGPDSVALMGLAAAAAAAGPFASLSVATVDHGFRLEGRRDAEAVVAAAEALGMPGHRLTWAGGGTATRLQERARDGRYALLVGCAARIGATHLVTAHTADDQAETVLLRLARGSGTAGLVGMRADSRRGDVRLVRPFLGVGKARLVASCRAAGWPFVEDPANADTRFARTRLRALLPALAAEGLDAARFALLARRMAEADAAVGHAAARALAEAAAEPGALRAGRLLGEPRAVFVRALALVLAEVGPDIRQRLARIERLAADLDAAAARGTPLRRTLQGALIDFDGRDRLALRRAPPRRADVPRAG